MGAYKNNNRKYELGRKFPGIKKISETNIFKGI